MLTLSALDLFSFRNPKIREEQRLERNRVAAERRKAELELLRKEKEAAERARIQSEAEQKAKEDARLRLIQINRLAKRNGAERDQDLLKTLDELVRLTADLEPHKAMSFELEPALMLEVFKAACRTCVNNTVIFKGKTSL